MEMKFKKDNLSDMTTEDLIKKKKSTSFATGLLTGVLIVLFMSTIFQTINKGFTTLLAVPFGLLPLLIMSYSKLNSMDKELKSRKTN